WWWGVCYFGGAGVASLMPTVALPLSTRQTSPTRCGALAGVYVTAPANDRRQPGQRADCAHTAQDADTLTDRMDGRKGHMSTCGRKYAAAVGRSTSSSRPGGCLR